MVTDYWERLCHSFARALPDSRGLYHAPSDGTRYAARRRGEEAVDDQAWLQSPAWREKLAAAQRDVDEGRVRSHESGEAFLASLDDDE